jgi:hypothetical protein
MARIEELERLLTLDQVEGPAGSADAHGHSSTHHLLDELLGRFEEDDSPILSARGLTSEFYADLDQ